MVGGLFDDAEHVRAQLDRLFAKPTDSAAPQRDAIVNALAHRFTVIAGGPGTGKTRTIAQLLIAISELAADRNLRLMVALAAPTGKAAARMTEAIRGALEATSNPLLSTWGVGETVASTIHRLLGATSDARFRHDHESPLPHDLVIVDETSMASLPLMARLLHAVHEDATVVLVGDPYQLESVETGAVLREVVATSLDPDRQSAVGARVVVLTRPHRFAGDSPVAFLATRYAAEMGISHSNCSTTATLLRSHSSTVMTRAASRG